MVLSYTYDSNIVASPSGASVTFSASADTKSVCPAVSFTSSSPQATRQAPFVQIKMTKLSKSA